MQYGDTLVPLGLDRLKVVEWLQALLALKDETVGIRIGELEIPKTILGLIKKYDMNSILHLKIYKIFEEALGTGLPSYLESVPMLELKTNSFQRSATWRTLFSTCIRRARLGNMDPPASLSPRPMPASYPNSRKNSSRSALIASLWKHI